MARYRAIDELHRSSLLPGEHLVYGTQLYWLTFAGPVLLTALRHVVADRPRRDPDPELANERWLAARQAELLPGPYFHLVFTLPHALNVRHHAVARRIESCSSGVIDEIA